MSSEALELARDLREAARRHNGIICDTGDRVTFARAADLLEQLATAQEPSAT